MKTLNVGFRTESFEPFAHLIKKIAREHYQLDLRPAPKFGKGEEAELSILGGELDFVLGNHYTPLAAKARRVHICWLAIPMVEQNYKIAARPDTQRAEDLAGKTILLPEGRCPALNMMLVLRKMGLEGKVGFVNSTSQDRKQKRRRSFGSYWEPGLKKVKEGLVDAVIVSAPADLLARRMGLRLLDTPRLEVIAGPCVTTTPSFARKDPELTKDILRAYLESIHAFKTDRKGVFDILGDHGFFEDRELVDAWYKTSAGRMGAKPYPTPESLEWTQAKAAIDYPETLAVNPMRLFELSYLSELDQEGFIDRLWAGHEPSP